MSGSPGAGLGPTVIMEFRTYRMQPGARAEFVAFFETEAIPRMREAGMTVLGQWSSVTDEDVFAYARTFGSLQERERQYKVFYESEDWLGWLIDTAMGKEESFIVFLGDSEAPAPPVRTSLSGVHADRFVLASSRGIVAALADASITVADDSNGGKPVFDVGPDVRVFITPNGRGMTPALSGTMADLSVGDRVLVLGARTPDGAVARQIVRRPA